MTNAPALSLIIGSSTGDVSYIVTMLRWVARQSVADQIEMVLVIPAGSQEIPQDAIAPFCDVKIIQPPAVASWADAMVTGVAASTSDIIVLGEDHAFPDAGWAEGLIRAHQQGHQVAGPVIANANPATGQSCINWIIDYGRWIVGNPSGEREDIPGHNSSYRRQILAEFAPGRLRELLEPGGSLHAELRGKGIHFYLTSEAVVYHMHTSRTPISIRLRFNFGRLLGQGRARDGNWGWPRRIAYTLASPLLLIMRLRYILQSFRQANQQHLLKNPRIAGWLAIALLAGIIGEAWAYLFGAGDAAERIAIEEFHKFPQMSAWDVAEAQTKWGASPSSSEFVADAPAVRSA